jgi:hypothetical protein
MAERHTHKVLKVEGLNPVKTPRSDCGAIQ